jgi:hypothetical protein
MFYNTLVLQNYLKTFEREFDLNSYELLTVSNGVAVVKVVLTS